MVARDRASAAALAGAALAIAALLGGCSMPKLPSVKVPGVYRIDVQQGNVIEQDMLDLVEPGMDKRKVRALLGTPLLTDPFNLERWDYFYSFQEGNGERVQRRVSLFFDDERLVRVNGDVEPSGDRREVAPRTEQLVTVPQRRRETFASSFTPSFLESDDPPPAAEQAASAAEQTAPSGGEAQPAVVAAAAPESVAAEPATDAPAPEQTSGQASDAEAAAASDVEGADESDGVWKRLMRRFKGSDDEPPESVGQPAEATVAAAAPARVADTPVEEEERALRDLFRGFGSTGTGSKTAPSPPDDDQPRVAATGAEPSSEAAENEDAGFFDRLMKRFKRDEAPETEDASPQPTPASAPDTSPPTP